MTTQTPQFPGIENLVEDISKVIPPYPVLGQPKKPKRKPPARREEHFPGSNHHFRELMAEQVKSRNEDYFSSITRQLFILLPEQLNTLRNIGLPQKTVDFIQSINFRFKPQPRITQYGTGLDVIQTIPPSQPDQPPDWPAWWLIWADQYIRYPRPSDAQIDATICQVIDAMNLQASAGWPSLRQVVANQPDHKPLHLSAVYTQICRITNTARTLTIPNDSIPYVLLTPEQLAGQLAEQDIPFETDMGTIPAAIRDIPAAFGHRSLSDVSIYPEHNFWTRHGVESAYLFRACAPQYPDEPPTHHVHSTQRFPDHISSDEHHLAIQTTPGQSHSHGPYDLNTYRKLAHLAILTGQTIDTIHRFLTDPTTPIPDTQPPPCPTADACFTACGVMQQQGRIAFPITNDGSHEDCLYHSFLSQNADREPTARQAAAADFTHRLNRSTARPSRRTANAEPAPVNSNLEETAQPPPQPKQQSMF